VNVDVLSVDANCPQTEGSHKQQQHATEAV